MKKTVQLVALMVLAIAAGTGCGSVEDKVVVRITDSEGAVTPREVTVGYVNDRIDRLPPQMMPEIGGDEGKREFIDEIIRKELLVIQGYRLGFQNAPEMEQLLASYEASKAWQIYEQRTVNDPAEPTDEDLAEYNVLRGATFELQQIVTSSEEEALAARRRITVDGEDFGAVAREVSAAPSAAADGVLPSQLWPDIHPVIGYTIADLEIGDVSEPLDLGGAYHVYKLLNRIDPVNPPPLEGQREVAVLAECRNSRTALRAREVNDEKLRQANLRYVDEAVELASARLGDQADEIIPENILELDFEARVRIAQIPLIPEFSEEEAAMEFLTYAIAGVDRTWTLGDLRELLVETPGMEGPKSGEQETLKAFLWKKILREIGEDEIERRGYRDSPEVREFLEERAEEYIVNKTYITEVDGKIIQPTGSEIREYFQSHRDDYMRPQRVDVRQLIVDTEAEANALRQRLTTGGEDFVELVRLHSVDGWSKSRDGLVPNYFQGERRLSHLQNVVFDLDIGEISQPVRAPGGYALITVIAKDPAYHLAFKEAGQSVIDGLLATRKEERLNELLDEIRASVTIEWLDENLVHVKDPAEAKIEKESQRGTVTP